MTPTIAPASMILAAWLAVFAGPQESTSVREHVTVAGTVDEINRFQRMVRLRVADNVTQDVYAPPEIALFDSLQVGDRVTARMRESVIVSSRPSLKPTLPADTTAEAKKQRTESDPQVLQQITAVITIDAVDRKAQTVIYHTADNRRVIRAVLDPKLLEGLAPGAVVEVTLTRERLIDLQRQ